jgi:hypothetical protein
MLGFGGPAALASLGIGCFGVWYWFSEPSDVASPRRVRRPPELALQRAEPPPATEEHLLTPERAVVSPRLDAGEPPTAWTETGAIEAPSVPGPESAVPEAENMTAGAETARPDTEHSVEGAERASDDGEPAEPAATLSTPRRRSRRVELASLRARRQPGLCNDPGDAIEAREALMRHFRHVDWDGEPLLYIDPRLAEGAHLALIAQLEDAEQTARAALRAVVSRPEVFAYFDAQLLLAAACTNDDVVAYYDGALHVVPSDADVRQSVVHEYTHHVLMSRGFIAPTWAQEGIAMNVAQESWWRGRQWLERVMDSPFSLAEVEVAIPYTMRSDQAVLFYVQSAAMVTCAARDQPDGVAGLVRSLYDEHPGDESSYELPERADPSEWRACFKSLLR